MLIGIRVIDDFRSKLSIWKVGHLSLGGRLTLIKAVLSSIPIYPLSVMLLPVRIMNTMHGIMRRFLWGETDDHRKLHLVIWDSITKPFRIGGLGVPDHGEMNAALLVKWIYRYSNKNDRL